MNADMGATLRWDLRELTQTDDPAAGVHEALDRAVAGASQLEKHRGTISSLDGAAFADVMRAYGVVLEDLELASSRAYLEYVTDMANPERGALLAAFQERATAISTTLLFLELEWAAVDDAQADRILAEPSIQFCAHSLRVRRKNRPFLLSEPEERILTEKAVTGLSAWVRLYDEQLSELTVSLDGEAVPYDAALSRLRDPQPEKRQTIATAINEALAPGMRSRVFIFNTLLADKATDDRLRSYPSWISARNLDNQASDESVQALVDAVVSRYDIPQRWYRLKKKLLGLETLHHYDRNAELDLGVPSETVEWQDAVETVRGAYSSFSKDFGALGDEFFNNRWIDVPATANKQGGAFCAPTTPALHPFLLLNYTGARHDVLTLAHELGHGVHFLLSGRNQSIFELMMPLTVAETASVFGETVTFGRLLEMETNPRRRLALLAENVDGQIATVFRQVAMWRFEDACHKHRRNEGELRVEDFSAHWLSTQRELFGDTVDITGYDNWWSYITHFIHVPGYVYAYAFGQLLALSVYRRYQETGPSFVPAYFDMLKAGGSRSPEDLAAMVGCDLKDPTFWTSGLALVDETLTAAEQAATAL